MKACYRGCLHREMVKEYHDARYAAELVEEQDTKGYETDMAIRRANGEGPITFKQWLISGRGSRRQQQEWEHDS